MSNCIVEDLVTTFELDPCILGNLSSAVQLGFIIGTLTFAILAFADRFPPSKVFFISAILSAFSNLGLLWSGNSQISILLFNFFTGFFLAGIYPVGMKISADFYDKRLCKSLGYLVGALVLGTALPHIALTLASSIQWQSIVIFTSILSVTGGTLMLLLVPIGPFRKRAKKLNPFTLFKVFKNEKFRPPAFGYFGHMWELYAFWTFVPILLTRFQSMHDSVLNIPVLSFLIIGVGTISCIVGGTMAIKFGKEKIAKTSLLFSGICCLILPLIFYIGSSILFVIFLIIWGMLVIADAPLFSTLIAQSTKPETKGTALTLSNSIGFAIAIISVQLMNYILHESDSIVFFMLLAIGPALGLLALNKSKL